MRSRSPCRQTVVTVLSILMGTSKGDPLEFTIKAGDKIKVRLAPGGGFAAKFISR